MTPLFSIDCHACGAKNTIDRVTLRRVHPTGDVKAAAAFEPARELVRQIKAVHLGSPEPAGDSDWPDPESAA